MYGHGDDEDEAPLTVREAAERLAAAALPFEGEAGCDHCNRCDECTLAHAIDALRTALASSAETTAKRERALVRAAWKAGFTSERFTPRSLSDTECDLVRETVQP